MNAPAGQDPFEKARLEFDRAMKRNVAGLGYFASAAPVLGASAKDVLISRGTMRLYHYRPRTNEVYRVPILLVMATTNRGYIFDMVPGQSLVEYLLDAGFDVFMLDWNAPRADEKRLGLADYVLDFLPSAVERILAETGESELTVAGYCFGGVLSVLWAALHPDGPMKNLVCFTTPVDFSHMEMFQAWADRRFFDVDRLVDTFGNCPADYLYTSFDMLRPAGRTAGNIRLWDNLWNDEYVKAVRMLDRWGADILPLAGEYFRETTKQLMWDNRLMDGSMTVAGRPLDLSNITAPFLHVTAEHDHIVPSAASAPLIDMIGSADKEAVTLKGGHVSLVAGGNAIKRMWPKLVDWLGERSIMSHRIRRFETERPRARCSPSPQRLPEHDLMFLGRDLRHPAVVEAWLAAIGEGWIDSFVAEDSDSGELLGTAALVRDPLGWSAHVGEVRLLVSRSKRRAGSGSRLAGGDLRGRGRARSGAIVGADDARSGRVGDAVRKPGLPRRSVAERSGPQRRGRRATTSLC